METANEALAREIRSRFAALNGSQTAVLRGVRREYSRRLTNLAPDGVISLATQLLRPGSGVPRFVVYEIVSHHKAAFESLRTGIVLKLGQGIDSWSAVDCFAMYLSGPAWMNRRIPDSLVFGWARSEDRWWRRAAVVSTVALSRRGDAGGLQRVVKMCALLVEDRDDMVVKALSWALRELAKKHPDEARRFLAVHREALAARVIREVENKLKTGLKAPRKAG